MQTHWFVKLKNDNQSIYRITYEFYKKQFLLVYYLTAIMFFLWRKFMPNGIIHALDTSIWHWIRYVYNLTIIRFCCMLLLFYSFVQPSSGLLWSFCIVTSSWSRSGRFSWWREGDEKQLRGSLTNVGENGIYWVHRHDLIFDIPNGRSYVLNE